MDQILIVENDHTLRDGLRHALAKKDRQIVAVGDVTGAREQLLLGSVQLVLLDISLPDGSGLSLLKEIRERDAALPVILLTANDTDADIVDGLSRGADDYVTKPFSLAVLRARVDAQLRKRAAAQEKRGDLFAEEPFRFDFEKMRFLVRGQPVELSRTEQRLLRTLTLNKGLAVSRERLSEAVWPDGTAYVDENALSVAVKRLRDKLGEAARIRTIYGVGYCWEKAP